MCAAAGIGERNRRPMPQNSLAAWRVFLAGNLDVSERKIRERRLPCEQQEWRETGRAPLQARGIRVSRFCGGLGGRKGGCWQIEGGGGGWLWGNLLPGRRTRSECCSWALPCQNKQTKHARLPV